MTNSDTNYCRACDLARHICPGCGADVEHGEIACVACTIPQPGRRTLNLIETTWGPGGPLFGTSRFHFWLRHRKAMRSCIVHCGCNCGGGWCQHNEFRVARRALCSLRDGARWLTWRDASQ